jgi:hypothetical protein
MRTKTLAAMSAMASLMAIASPAHAVVVTYTGPPITIENSIDGLYLNVVTGSTSVGNAGWDMNIYNNSDGLAFFARIADAANGYVGSFDEVASLAPGSTVGPASSFIVQTIAGGIGANAFLTPGDRFFGFRFTSEGTNTVHYGWAQMRNGATNGFPAAILSYAFESTPNLGITVVPEPATYALMALGLAAVGGIAARRRKAETAA